MTHTQRVGNGNLRLVTAPSDEQPATAAETRAALLTRARRKATPLRKIFVQQPSGASQRPSLLADFVRRRDKRALNAYLFILAVNSSGANGDGWSCTQAAGVWTRALDLAAYAQASSAATALAKTLKRLHDRHLITRCKVGKDRLLRLGLLKEDGSGQPYTRPGHRDSDRYLKLPNSYWTDGWHDQLSLPAIAMLLVSLHERNPFRLPTEKVPEWYGWSADTAERGFAELIGHQILGKSSRTVKAELSSTGLATINEYALAVGWLAVRAGHAAPSAHLAGQAR